MIARYILTAVIAYAMGNINPSIIIGRIRHIDIRKEGSGNAGMTNTIRVMGLGAGITVLVVDVLKAFIAVKIGAYIAGLTGAMIAFAAVVIGHCFPAAFGFKGGKGVAASLGAALALNWMSALAALLVAAIVFAVSRRMSLASLGAAAAYPFLIWHFETDCLYFAICAAVFLIIMHSSNISRLIKGEEKQLSVGNKKDGQQ